MSPKVVKVEKWKSYFKTFGTCVKKYHNVPSLPVENYIITKLLKVKGKYGGRVGKKGRGIGESVFSVIFT